MRPNKNLRHLNRPIRNQKKLSLSELNVKKKRRRRSLKILKYKTFHLTTCKCVRFSVRSLVQCFHLSLLTAKGTVVQLLGESGKKHPVNLLPCKITKIDG